MPSGKDTDSHTPSVNTTNMKTNMTSNTRPSNTNNNNNTWVRNFSRKLLIKAQDQVLAQGPNFALVIKHLPIGEYVAAIEKTCQQLKQGKAEELREEIKSILKNINPPKPNITKEEAKAIRELKDNTRIILTTDKRVSMAVLDREEYIKKAEELLNQATYRAFPLRSSNKLQKQVHCTA